MFQFSRSKENLKIGVSVQRRKFCIDFVRNLDPKLILVKTGWNLEFLMKSQAIQVSYNFRLTSIEVFSFIDVRS